VRILAPLVLLLTSGMLAKTTAVSANAPDGLQDLVLRQSILATQVCLRPAAPIVRPLISQMLESCSLRAFEQPHLLGSRSKANRMICTIQYMDRQASVGSS
jgi:hypothetical protein